MKKLVIFFVMFLMLNICPQNAYAIGSEQSPEKVSNVTVFSGGQGTENDPYLVSTKEDLNNVRNYLTSNYKLVNDITFSESDFLEGGSFYNGGLGWDPIGNNLDNSFSGLFDGNGYSIKGIKINRIPVSGVSYLGLFGYTSGAIQNLTVSDIDISVKIQTRAYIGGISGCVNNGKVEDCAVSGNLVCELSTSGYEYVGGIVGEAQNSIIENTSSTMNCISNNGYAGGICGYLSNSTIKSCQNKGNITLYTGYIGGITGASNSGSIINNCYNIGHIKGTGDVGGIIGSTSSDVISCYNKGPIEKPIPLNTSEVGSNSVGGIAGALNNNSHIKYCYNRGNISLVTQEFFAGGIVGHSVLGKISECYNIGDIELNNPYGDSRVGAIVGKMSSSQSPEYCYNTGDITGVVRTNYASNDALIEGASHLYNSFEISFVPIEYNYGKENVVFLSTRLPLITEYPKANYLKNLTYSDETLGDTWMVDSSIESHYPFLQLKNNPMYIEEISMSVENLVYLKKGDEKTLAIEVSDNYPFGFFDWESDNSDIVSVDETGKVSAKEFGHAYITVNSFYGNKSCKSLVVVQKDINDCNIQIDDEGLEVTGEELYPRITIMDGDYELVEGKDYTLSGENNIKCGNANVKITGMDHYYGEYTRSFTINHGLIEGTGKAPDCDDSGYRSWRCMGCFYNEILELPPIGHSFPEWEILTPSTCTKIGEKTRQCEKCHIFETVKIPPTGHMKLIDKAVPPTCIKDGLTEGSHCSVCNMVFEEQKVLEATGHVETSGKDSIPPTCVSAGATESIYCLVCNEILKEQNVIAPIGHEFGEWIVDKEVTCTEDGSKHKECANCDAVEILTIVCSGHSWNDRFTVDKEASCTEEGSKSIHCSKCTERKNITVIEKTAHAFGDWIIDQKATCTVDGSKHKECENCDATKSDTIASVGHSWNQDYTIDKNPTCTEEGSKSIHCSKCGATKEPIILEKIEHSFNSWSTIKEPTIYEEGILRKYCKTCDHYEETVIEKVIFEEFSIDKNDLLMLVGKTETITATYRPENLNVTWSTDNPAVAMIDNTGVISAIGEGECNVYADLAGYKLKCKVVVKEGEDLGTCGENVFWLLNKDGQLTLWGHGAMTNNKEFIQYKDQITSVVIEDGVTEICDDAFYCFNNINCTLNIPETVVYIGDRAFTGCTGFVGELILPVSVKYIGIGSFADCNGFTGDLVIPDSVVELGRNAFSGCLGFSGKLHLSSNLKSIPASCFALCLNLSGPLVIPESVMSIDPGAFYHCDNLSGNLVIPDNVTIIGEDAFSYCENLTGSLIIPEGVKSVGQSAFYGCSGLNSITILNKQCEIYNSEYVFHNQQLIGYPDSTTYKYAQKYGLIFTCLQHIWFENFTIDKEANCKETGSKSIHCSKCAEIRDVTVIEKAPHAFGDWITDTEPFCTADGSKHKECANCNATEFGTIPASGHSWNEIYTIDKNPTCTEEGSKSIHCSKCAETKEVTVIEKTSHAFGDWIIDAEPSCTADGNKHKECTNCDATESGTIPSNGHDWNNDFTVDKEASCTEEGSKSIHCSKCAETKDATVIKKLAHAYGDWITDEEATCTADGSKHKECANCDATESGTIPSNGHDWNNDFTVDKEASCTEEGSKSIHCSKCTATKDETVIEKLDHAHGDWITTKEATCTEVGSKYKKCTCGDTVTEEIPVTEHPWNEHFTVDKEASCTEEGSKSIHCSKCNAAKDVRVIEKTAHAYGNDSICDVCGFENETLKPAPTPTPGTGGSGGTTPTPTPTPGTGESGGTVTPTPTPDPTPTPTPEKVTIGKVTLSASSYVYNGKVKAPKVIVKDSKGNVLKKNVAYTVTTPKGRKAIGKYTYTIKFKGDFAGTKAKKLTLTIKPKAPTITAPKAAKKAVTVKWKKGKKAQVTGYQVMVATNKKFTKNAKTVNVKGYKVTSKKVTKLKAKTKYFVKVRTYKTVKGVKIYSSWSKVKTIRPK